MSPMLVKAAIAGLAKGVAAIVGITLTAILARVLGADEAGLFFLGLSLLMGLSVVFRLGLDDLVLRAMGAEYLSVACQSKLNTGLIWIVVATEPLPFFSQTQSRWRFSRSQNSPWFWNTVCWHFRRRRYLCCWRQLSRGCTVSWQWSCFRTLG